ncbi:RING-type domain-containing protein [Plasmodiophora brassicae]|uniref:RING-type domain-containing protein n=1 Tax=Plasmodiophora brassicae TaxID=37360 RepID=A0A0G4J5Y9_PLABS|nr:hypothetical protein PBRA_002752 [Plasmodiophora brassicae]SPQ94900.1 unnamed protein product [Plasmodiophora brassicae]
MRASPARRRQHQPVYVVDDDDDDDDDDDLEVVIIEDTRSPRRRRQTSSSSASSASRPSRRKRSKVRAATIDLTVESDEDGTKPKANHVNGLADGVSDQILRQLSCPICLDPIKELSSSTCGHVFCHTCIREAVRIHHRCPSCQRKLNLRDIHRIYL